MTFWITGTGSCKKVRPRIVSFDVDTNRSGLSECV